MVEDFQSVVDSRKRGVSAAITSFAVIVIMVVTGSLFRILYTDTADRDEIADNISLEYSPQCGRGVNRERVFFVSMVSTTSTSTTSTSTTSTTSSIPPSTIPSGGLDLNVIPRLRETDWNADFNQNSQIDSVFLSSVRLLPPGSVLSKPESIVIDRISRCWGVSVAE